MLNFDKLKVSTKTIIAMTNLIIDIGALYPKINITDYITIKKKNVAERK